MSAVAAPDPTEPNAFDLCGPLPVGTTVLEASAGTGKTYAIAALAARYVAAGVPIGSILVATFGRMATDELRSRVRERLVDLEARLAAALAGRPADTDAVTQLVVTEASTAGRLDLVHQRAATALAEFDGATVSTTHEFAGQMLAGLGVLGDQEPGAQFVESMTDLVQEVATDCFLQRFATRATPPPLTYDEAFALARTVVEFGHTRLVPDRPDADASERRGVSEWVDRVGFAHEVRAEVARRKVRGQVYSYDDLLTRLLRSLTDPEHGDVAARRLRQRYRIVLIDEFQDTDPVQWEILQRAFVATDDHRDATTDPARALVLIGDPKQAIYAFRGADVFSYLDATHDRPVQTLDVNRRSDAHLVAALDALFADARLGQDIVVRPVQAAHQQGRLRVPAGAAHAGAGAPFRLRVIGYDPASDRLPKVDTLRPRVVADLVADVGRTLASGATLGIGDATRLVGPRDLAVLVHKNKTGQTICDALAAAGVPAVMIGAASVFDSDAARDWLTLLQALDQPRSGAIRQAALTCFVGRDLPWLAAASEQELADLTQLLRTWSRVLARRGVAALVESVTSRTDLTGRLLAQPHGERRLTDVRHVGQLLHAAASRGQLGAAALLEWLRDRVAEGGSTGLGERTRRLETERDAVAVLTVHRSKGLQFPIVYVPELWDRYVRTEDDGAVHQLHERIAAHASTRGSGDDVECVLDVGGLDAPGRRQRFAAQLAEDASEDLRLAYVALTRAESQIITWWAPSKNTEHSALQRFLYASRTAGTEPAPQSVHSDPTTLPTLGPGFSVEPVVAAEALRWDPPTGVPAGALSARTSTRTLDTAWRRTSYSGLTAAAHGLEPAVSGGASEAMGTEDDEQVATDATPFGPPATDGEADGVVSPMADLPGGTGFGSTVHAVLERFDLDAAEPAAELRAAVAAELTRAPSPDLTVDGLTAGLLPALTTPLGPLADDLTLVDLHSGDRLPELDFELPLSGGDLARDADPPLTLEAVADLLAAHLPADDLLAGYPDLLRHPLLAEQTLRGYLTGSIDAVLRVGGTADPRYLVVDYKTNVVGWTPALESGAEQLTLSGYRPDRLAGAMAGAHYPLQALLYQVAVHRFLRWRQPGYDPARHLGGVLYLFLRGMVGIEPPRHDGVPYGVFSWRPPAALIVALSDLLDRGTS
ncbi:MAG: UvrD-helicase domain-containing protein [Propionibacteriaceae bacterium]